jgi:hypothetical protein
LGYAFDKKSVENWSERRYEIAQRGSCSDRTIARKDCDGMIKLKHHKER